MAAAASVRALTEAVRFLSREVEQAAAGVLDMQLSSGGLAVLATYAPPEVLAAVREVPGCLEALDAWPAAAAAAAAAPRMADLNFPSPARAATTAAVSGWGT